MNQQLTVNRMGAGGKTIWRLVIESAEALSAAGDIPFTVAELTAKIQRTHPEYGANSIAPVVQGLTDNAKGGVPSPPGKTVLHRVSRGRYVLRDDADRYPPDSSESDDHRDSNRSPDNTPIQAVSEALPRNEPMLRFSEHQIESLAKRYSYARDDRALTAMRPKVQECGYLTKDQLNAIVSWKAPRIAGHVDRNDDKFVQEITAFAFSAVNERARIESLTLLDGVQWPTASVILHLFHKDPYPILDFRALWSVGLEVPQFYTFGFWWPYVRYCRGLARRNHIDMRTLDRALWQFSKENASSRESDEPAEDVITTVARGGDQREEARFGSSESIRLPTGNSAATEFWVSCVSQKREEPAPARDLYISDWFSKARAFVESRREPWFILSAKYGLVAPEEVIEPYELTLNTLPVAERRRWADHVLTQLNALQQLPRRIVMLAGARYREFLEPALRSMGIEVEVPMEGLRIGEQLSWLSQPSSGRVADLERFYSLLDQLESKLGGKRKLAECHGRMDWPQRGVYFFFEPGEQRTESGSGLRVTRVGTHALTTTSGTTLWGRLSQHRGVEKTGGGNHRGSIFRLILGTAIKRRDGTEEPSSWGIGGDPGVSAERLDAERSDIRAAEEHLEAAVSRYIGEMPFLWLDIDDEPGPASLRGLIERNTIALLSNFERQPIDPASRSWLGHHSDRERVRKSGLWNNNHVDESYDPDFLATLEALIEQQ